MRKLTSFILLTLLTVQVPGAYAADDFGLPGEFLNFGVGARPLAMGRAFTGIADDIDAIYWNPGGLSSYKSNQFTVQHSPLKLGGAYQYLAYSQPVYHYGTFGFSVVNLTSGDVDRRDANNVAIGSFKKRETAYSLAYSYRLKEKLGVGGTIKMAENTIDSRKARGVGADIGALYSYNELISIGATIRNLIPPVYKYTTDDERFPTIFRTGASAKLWERRLLTALDFSKTIGTSQGIKWHWGIEGRVVEKLTLRFGLDSTEITAGMGFNWKSFQFDYAAGLQDLGLANRASVKYFFGGYEADVKASPRVFSPIGLKNRTVFKIRAYNRKRIVRWIITVRDQNNNVVKSFQGYQSPPKSVVWDGKRANGRVADPGEYTYRMLITDKKGRSETTPSRSIRILAPTPFEIEAK